MEGFFVTALSTSSFGGALAVWPILFMLALGLFGMSFARSGAVPRRTAPPGGLQVYQQSTASRPRIAQFRPVETIAYPGAAVPTRTKIPHDYVLSDINLFVSGTIEASVANGTALAPEQPLSIIRRIRVEGASGVRPTLAQIKDADCAAMFRLQHILLGTPGTLTPVSSPNIGVYNFAFDVRIDFMLTGAIEDLRAPFSGPGETLLRGDELNALDLIIEWGTGADMITPAGTTVLAISNCTATLGIREYKDPESLSNRYKVHRLSFIEKVNAAASAAFNFDLRGRNVLRGLLIKQFTQATGINPHTPVDSVIQSLRLRLNSDVREDWNPEDALRADNKVAFSVETMPTGYLFVDLLHGGHRELAVNTGGFASVDLDLTTATVADSKVRVYPIEIIAG